MEVDSRASEVDLEEEETLRIDLGLEGYEGGSSLCLIRKVFTRQNFNTFGFLEVMKRAMALAKGFVAREIDKNLFSFKFNSENDMKMVLEREPWLFKKNVVMLKELERGEQPADISFNWVTFWIWLYELPQAARNQRVIRLIVGKMGELFEIDTSSMEGFSRSIRAKVSLDPNKPLKAGIHMELQGKSKVWINFNYERLPSFCYICGALGHMRKECDLTEGPDDFESIQESKLPFGEWMRASPMKKASVSTIEHPIRHGDNSLR
ncbi:hypothetical protein ACS0TY_006204 [Phlomoides rotata]